MKKMQNAFVYTKSLQGLNWFTASDLMSVPIGNVVAK